MDDSGVVPIPDPTKGQALVEPSLVTHSNVSVLCDALVFTYPTRSSAEDADLVRCIEELVEKKLEHGKYVKQDLEKLMDIEEEVCELKVDVKKRLEHYQLRRSKLISNGKKMDLNGNVGSSLEKTMKRITDMRRMLKPVEASLKLAIKKAASTPLEALCVHVNGKKERLSLSDELEYMKLFKCQTMLLHLGVAMNYEASRVDSLSKVNCAKVFAKLKSISERKDEDVSKAVISCRAFLAHYASYMWNISFMYRMVIRSLSISVPASDGEKSFLELKACVARHCINELQNMFQLSNGSLVRDSINKALACLRVGLNSVLMMHYYKNHNYRLAYRTHLRTSKMIQSRFDSEWFDKFKQKLDYEMAVVVQMPLNSWNEDIDKDDDTGEFGRPRSIKPP